MSWENSYKLGLLNLGLSLTDLTVNVTLGWFFNLSASVPHLRERENSNTDLIGFWGGLN